MIFSKYNCTKINPNNEPNKNEPNKKISAYGVLYGKGSKGYILVSKKLVKNNIHKNNDIKIKYILKKKL